MGFFRFNYFGIVLTAVGATGLVLSVSVICAQHLFSRSLGRSVIKIPSDSQSDQSKLSQSTVEVRGLRYVSEKPAEIAKDLSTPDEKLVKWLVHWETEVANNSVNDHRDEYEAVSLDGLLATTPLDASELAKIGLAFSAMHGSLEWAISRRFLIAAETKAVALLTNSATSQSLRDATLQIMWNILPTFESQSEWDDARLLYATLSQQEQKSGERCYRARLKYADMLLECHRPDDGLNVIDSLIDDVNKGLYRTANLKDIAKVRWALCVADGKSQDGIAYLTRTAKEAAGTRYEREINQTLIYALVDTGQIEEAKERYASWSQHSGVPQDERNRLGALIAAADWKRLHRN
jgi:hypothetical protein